MMQFHRFVLSAVRVVRVVCVAGLLLSSSNAQAFVTVEHVDDTGGAAVSVGQTFQVDVLASNDGALDLWLVAASAQWDPTEVMLLGATDSPTSIFAGPNGSLSRLSNPASFPIDPAGTLRTVQHGVFPLQYSGTGSDVLITTLTFQVLSAGDGIADISAVFLSSDLISGGVWGEESADSTFTYGPGDYALIGTSVAIIPEPSTALGLGLGLSVLARRRRRD